jgi:hypothetical protein
LFSRPRLKLGLLACLVIFGVTVVLSHEGRPRHFSEEEAICFLERGSAAGAIAISIALIATI